MIRALPFRYEIREVVEQIQANPSVWNRHRGRVDAYDSPHQQISDIWVRYNAIENRDADPVAFYHGEHESVWYPVADEIPAVPWLVQQLFNDVRGERLGGVLITKIPPGGEVKPHIDTGWHAGFYDKYAIQLQGNKDQAFCFEDSRLSALPGESYTFDNSKLHWVTNESAEDRMTLIVCIRKNTHAPG